MDDEEVDTLGEQLVDAVTVTALLGIDGIELGLQLGDDPASNRRVGRDRFDRDAHGERHRRAGLLDENVVALEEFVRVEEPDGIRMAASAAEVYDEFFVPALFDQWPEQVLDVAAVAPGHLVLDVGCGTGILTRTAARRVGREGHVAGLDPNPAMLSVARRSAEPIEWREGVAESLPFKDGSFHRVVSQFAAMFFTDAETAISEMTRVLALSGRVAIATWAAGEDTRLFGDGRPSRSTLR